MIDSSNKKNVSNSALLMQYAGIGAQIFAGLIIGVFAGKWIDEKIQLSFPVFIWLLPLIFMVAMIFKVLKDTSTKKENE